MKFNERIQAVSKVRYLLSLIFFFSVLQSHADPDETFIYMGKDTTYTIRDENARKVEINLKLGLEVNKRQLAVLADIDPGLWNSFAPTKVINDGKVTFFGQPGRYRFTDKSGAVRLYILRPFDRIPRADAELIYRQNKDLRVFTFDFIQFNRPVLRLGTHKFSKLIAELLENRETKQERRSRIANERALGNARVSRAEQERRDLLNAMERERLENERLTTQRADFIERGEAGKLPQLKLSRGQGGNGENVVVMDWNSGVLGEPTSTTELTPAGLALMAKVFAVDKRVSCIGLFN